MNWHYLYIAQEKDDAVKQKHDKKPVDLDPEGDKYANTEKPLEDALLFVKPLELLAPENAQVHALGFEIYIRQEKYLLAVKALGKIAKIEKKTPKAKLDRLEAAVKAHKDLDPKIKQVVDLELAEISKV